MRDELLSGAVLLGALFSKSTQFSRIVRSNSVAGLSTRMFAADLFAQSVSALHLKQKGLGVLAYAELVVLAAQNAAIIGCIGRLRYQWRYRTICGAVVLFVLCIKRMKRYEMERFVWLSMPISLLGRLEQIAVNRSSANTGQLSATPFMFNIIGSLARLITAKDMLKGDKSIIASLILSVLINGVLMTQVFTSRKMNKI
jgi:hypothetical protein